MTCVLGYTDGATMIFASDSARASSESEIYTVDWPKIFVRDDYLVGYTGSTRIGQIVQYRAELPASPRTRDLEVLEAFLVSEVVPALREAVRREGVEKPGAVLGERTVIMVGLRGAIFTIHADLTVNTGRERRYAAIGSGRHAAWPVLEAFETADVRPLRRRLELTLAAVAEYVPSVRPPWHFLEISPAEAL